MNATNLANIGRQGLVLVLGGFACAGGYAESAKPAITPSIANSISFDKQDIFRIQTGNLPISEQKLIARMPANFHHFGAARDDEPTDAQTLTMRFPAATKLGKITSTPDFHVEQGSSCVEGNVYEARSSCTLLVRFIPKGAGHRLGKLTVATTAPASSNGTKAAAIADSSAQIGLGGYGYVPVVSFTPGLIETVPASIPGGKGLLSNSFNLAVDGGDGLYVSDYGNNLVRYMDSSNEFTTIAGGGTTPVSGDIFNTPASDYKLNGPYGVGVDGFGDAYFTDKGDNELLLVYPFGGLSTAAGGGTGTSGCFVPHPCVGYEEELSDLQSISVDHSGNVFFAAGSPAESIADATENFEYLDYYFGIEPTLLVDSNDNLYSEYSGYYCYIFVQSQAYSDTGDGTPLLAAGTRNCGFSGDGGQAKDAEIGSVVPQMAFDIAGNLYFSDQNNHRVRRIDAQTGIIHTIAGDSTSGYNGDGGPATSAELNAPTGVAVDSQGQVYIISGTGVGAAQAIRKVGANGALTFASQLKGTASATKTVSVANTGNDSLTVTKVVVTGADKGDFAIDPNTTSCNFASGNYLAAGSSCLVGVIFTPGGGGARTASLTLLDNTVNNSNTVQLTGTGTLPAPVETITAPAAGSSSTSGTAVKFSVTVTSPTGPAPTGTVQFSVDGVAFDGPVTLASGAASVSLTGLSVKTHTIAAYYGGDGNYASAFASESITVTAAKVKPAVALASMANPAAASNSIAFNVGVSAQSKNQPTGVVHLDEGSTMLAKGTLANGAVSITIPALSSGTHMLTAVYEGNSEYAAANSAPLKEVVK